VSVLVLGLGNTLLCDDGVGVHVVRHIAGDPATPAYVYPIDGGTLGFRLMGALTGSGAVIVVDAAELGEPAGTVRLLEGALLACYAAGGDRMSAHEAGLADLLTLVRLDGWTPLHLAVLGVQPQRIEWGGDLSDAVALALPTACEMVLQTAASWQ
jgi:hydrogenase maturation protease